VAVEDQRLAAHRAFRLVDADHVVPAFVRQDRRRVAGVVTDLVLVDRELVDAQAVALEFAAHQRLRALLGAQQRGLGDQLAQQRHGFVALEGNGRDDLGFGQRVQGGGVHGRYFQGGRSRP